MTGIVSRSYDALSTATGLVVGVLILGVAYQGSSMLPLLDGWVEPVIRFDQVTDLYREAHDNTHPTGYACFTLHMTKLRYAKPLPYRFYIETWLSEKLGIAPFIADGNTNVRAAVQRYQEFPPGVRWTVRYCFDLPGAVNDAESFVVSGAGFHNRHWFWDTETLIPSFTVPATVAGK